MEKKVKVNSWLEKVYGKGQVPTYQDTPECLEHLEKIMELSEQEEHGMELISQLQIHQMAEYKEETDKIKQRFDILGLNAKAGGKMHFYALLCTPMHSQLGVHFTHALPIGSA